MRGLYLGTEPQIPDEECAAGRQACWGSRWSCADGADWQFRSGESAWGANDTEPTRLAYLATATAEELDYLSQLAHGHLDDGYWQGFPSPNGGWADGEPWDDHERAWREAARDFMERWDEGERWLTEGMLRYANYDLSRELAWVRSWCPAEPHTSSSESSGAS